MKYLLIALVALLIACNNAAEPAPEVNKTAAVPTLPSMDLRTADGSYINLSSLKGKKIFVNLWATWCPPCRAEMPGIQRLAGKVDSSKVAFVMLSLDEEFEAATRYAKQTKLNLPVYHPASGLPTLFQTGGIPVTYIFNEAGELIFRHDRADNYDQPKFVEMLNN